MDTRLSQMRTNRPGLVFVALSAAALSTGFAGHNLIDDDGDGWGRHGGDCNDRDPATYPDAPETCDGQDNDCDGIADEGLIETWYHDGDLDGFGVDSNTRESCAPGEDYSTSRGDCDDGDSRVHPGAPDQEDDGVDQDCGGTDAPEPHVGLSESSSTSIQEALDAALDGATVWVGPGIYLEHDISFQGKGLSLVSTRGAESTIVDAGKAGHVFVFNSGEPSSTELRGFTITGGLAQRGGGIRISASSPRLVDLVIESNEATTDGGGFNAAGGAPTFQDCTIRDNHAPTDLGGGGFFNSSTTLILENVFFEGNTAKHGGGGLYGRSGWLFAIDVEFEWNEVTGSGANGGGVYLDNITADWEGGVVNSNLARAGGGLFVIDSDLDLDGVLVTNNEANEGGGLFLETSFAALDIVDFVDNVANEGGGILSSASELELLRCSLDRNSATLSGGGALLSADSTMTVDTSRFRLNRSDTGGGIYVEDSTLEMVFAWLEGNIARYGGAVFAAPSSASQIALTDCELDRNNASLQGGGMFLAANTQTSIKDSGFRVNKSRSGGAISLDSGRLEMDGVRLTGNIAQQGGAICAMDSTLDARKLYLSSNQAKVNGGGMYLRGSSMTLENSTLLANFAWDEGGGIDVMGGQADIVDTTFSSNMAPYGGGASLRDVVSTLTHVVFAGNVARYGAGLALDGSSPTIRQATIVSNLGGYGGGIYLVDESTQPLVQNSIVALNEGYNIFNDESDPANPTVTFSDLYNPSGMLNHNLDQIGSTNLKVDPGFMVFDPDNATFGDLEQDFYLDLHLGLDSPLVDAGDPDVPDRDGSDADIGVYGGPGAGMRDRDSDGTTDYFWPGSLEDAPAGTVASEFDCNDFDPTNMTCG